jgi:hypothetical protein
MASPALATTDDLEARGVDTSDAARAQAALDDASNWIHEATNSVWIADDGSLVDTIPSVALTICCAVARRILTNPDGITSESLGPFSQGQSHASSDVYLTKAETRILRRAAGVGVGAITLESPYPLRVSNSDIYVPWVDQESEQFPMGPFPTET